MDMNSKYVKNIIALANLCMAKGIPFMLNIIFDGLQMRFPWCDSDVICHNWSYNSDDGLVETYGFPWDDDDVTKLTPEEAAIKIDDYYHSKI